MTLSSILQASPSPKELHESLRFLTPRERAELDALLTADVPWEPFPGKPQEAAYQSEADVLGFGGAAGGGKTDLLLGLASTAHQKSIIFRRELAQLEGLETRAHEMFDGKGRFNSTKHRWRLEEENRVIEFGGVEREKDVGKYQGRPHDLKGFDELPFFSEYQFRYLSGWNRSSRPGQRKRIVAAFNPPTTSEGDWVIGYFGPWLDKRHPRPALPGELRFFAMLGGVEREVRNGLPFWWINEDGEEELIEPRSRTFIPARVEDNPILMASGYKSTLQALPEPLRSLMLKGAFGLVQTDHPWQVIPTAWVEAAQARWKKLTKQERGKLSQLGVDVARGGKDKTTIAPRFGNWFDEVITKPGKATPDGQTIIKDVVTYQFFEEHTKVSIDGIAVGSSPVDIGRMFKVNIVPLIASNTSYARDKSGKLGFVNKRAEWIWLFREALDPDSGQDIALPPDRELLADLTAARYELTVRGIKIEPKDDIKERIKRSPDKGEAVIYAHAQDSGGYVRAPAIVLGTRREIPGAGA